MPEPVWDALSVFGALVLIGAVFGLAGYGTSCVVIGVVRWVRRRRFDRHTSTAMALLTPDALPPCDCEVCEDLTDEAVRDVFAEIEADSWRMPPQPPISPGRTDG